MIVLRGVTLTAIALAIVACGIDAVGTRPGEDGGAADGDASTATGDGAAAVDDASPNIDGGTGDAQPDSDLDAGAEADASVPLVQYMHSATVLYEVNGVSGLTKPIATFGGACSGITVGDLAIDRAGNAWVATLPPAGADSTLHALNLQTGVCGASVGDMGRRCNALTFAPDPADGTKDVLFAACTASFYRVSTADGATTLVGALGAGLASSGDIVWVPGRGVFIALDDSGSTDKLGSIDLASGAATVIGAGVGRSGVFALGHRAGVILGYGGGYAIEIDPTTGAGTTWNAATGITAYGAASGP